MDSQMLLEERRLVQGADTFESHKIWSMHSIRFTTKGLVTRNVIFGPSEGPNSNGLCVLIGVLFREKAPRSSVSSEIDPTNQVKRDLITSDHALYGVPSRVPSAFGLIWSHDSLSLNFPFFQCCKSLLHTVEATKSHYFAALPAELGTRYLDWSDYDAETLPKMIVLYSLHCVPVPREVPGYTLVSLLTVCLNLLSTAITTEIYAKFTASALWLSRLVSAWQNRRLSTTSSFIILTKVSHRHCNTFPHGSWTSTKHPSPPRAKFGSVLLRILLLLLLWTHTAMCSMNNSNGHISLPSLSTAANIPTSEWNALYDLYNATNGFNWDWSKNPTTGIAWNFTKPALNNPCVDHWQGVICTYFPQNEYYHVTQIELSSYGLAGQLLPSLSALSELVHLELNTNQLTGIIPDSLGSLSELFYLDLSDNILTGPIPESLGNLSQLQNFYLYTNKLTGPIPESLGNLTQLLKFALYSNMLTGPILNSLCSLSQIQILYLDTNKLTGPIPEWLGNLTQLQQLALFSNMLSGPIPDSLGSLSELLSLDLSDNLLTGPIPESLGNLSQLQILYLYTSILTGPIPQCLGNLSQLQQLVLYDNELTGPAPESLESLFQLQVLYLYANMLTGPIPEWLGSLTQLLSLDLDTNKLTGPIPESLGSLRELLALILSGNILTGSIPKLLGGLTQLLILDLGTNKLTGPIPELLGNLTQLLELDLDTNKFTGEIPESLGNLVYLKELILDTNLLSGTIPSFSSAPSLRTVLLRNNRLVGNLEGLFDPSTQSYIETINFNSNQLTGTLPEAIFKLEPYSFSAVDNCLEGPLPISAICNNLIMTDLILDGMSSARSCQKKLFASTYTLKYDIGGALPTCLFQLPNITTLHLSGNGFTSSIPGDIVLSETLTDLALSHNALTGSIPPQIQLKVWSSIDLSYNRLSGTLQPSFASNKSIDLENNRLSGDIPLSFYTVRNISVLGSNMFSCSYDQSDLPQYDTGRQRYHCGSNSFNSIFFTWLGAMVCATVFLGYVKLKYPGFDTGAILSNTHLHDSLAVVCKLSLSSAFYSIVVLLPVYSVCSMLFGTQSYTYAYQIGAVFLSGVVPFALNLFLWVVLVFAVAIAVKMTRLLRERQAVQRKTVLTFSFNWRDVIFIFIPYLVVNSLVVVGANAAYVYVAVYKGGSLLLVAQTLLSVFKVVWGRWALSYMLTRLAQARKYGKLQAITETVLNISNNIIIPCLVVAGVSPNCFYYALVTAPPVESTTVSAECIYADPSSNLCLEFNYTYDRATYDPPFSYNYQCSASLVTYYSPAFISMCIVSFFITPLAQYMGMWLYTHSTAYPYWHRLLDHILPKVMKPIDLAAAGSSKGFLNCSGLMTTLIGFLALILTFGVMFPPLCVALTVSVLASVYVFRVNVRRFINSATEQQRDQIVKILQVECNSEESMQMLKYSVWVLVTVSCWFYTLFLFDTLGDAVGFEGAYWVLIVMPLMPLVLYVVYLVVCKYCINVNGWDNEEETGPDHQLEQAVEIEIPTISVVHNVLVVGAENDAGSDC